jgi:hypothetical protein
MRVREPALRCLSIYANGRRSHFSLYQTTSFGTDHKSQKLRLNDKYLSMANRCRFSNTGRRWLGVPDSLRK